MEPFKIALKIAIDQEADKISFVEGRLPVMWKSDKEIAINHQPIVQKVLLSQLFTTFFPANQDKLLAGQPVQGPLKVVDVGNLILLAVPGKPSALNVYFPGHGEQYFADDWRSLARARGGAETAAPAAAPPPPPPLAAVPTPPASTPPSAPVVPTPPEAAATPDAPTPPAPPPQATPEVFKLSAVTPAEAATPSYSDSLSQRTPPLPMADPRETTQAPESGQQLPSASDPNINFSQSQIRSLGDHSSTGQSSTGQSSPSANNRGQSNSGENHGQSSPEAFQRQPANSPANSPQQASGQDDSAKPFDPFGSQAGQTPTFGAAGVPPGQQPPAASAFGTAEVSQLHPRPPEKPVRQPIEVAGKDIEGLMAIMSGEGFDQLVLSPEQKAAFFDRSGKVASHTPLTAVAIETAITALFPDASSASADVYQGWRRAGGDGFRLRASFGQPGAKSPWLTLVRKPDPLSQSAKELMIPEGIASLAWLDRGLIILAGEQGSGKTTTAHHWIDRINKNRDRNILLVQPEDAADHSPQKSSIRTLSLTRDHGTGGARPEDIIGDPADTLLVDCGAEPELIHAVLKAVNQGKLAYWVLPGQCGGEALGAVLRTLKGTQEQALVPTLLSHLEAVVSQTILTSAGHVPVPLFEAWPLTGRHKKWLKENGPHHTKGVAALFELMGPDHAGLGVSYEKSILSALSLRAITPAEVRKQFFDKERVDTLFAEAGISSFGKDGRLIGDSLEAS